MPKPVPSGTIELVTPNPALGGTAVFNVTVEDLHGNQNPRVEVLAYQDSKLVYGMADNVGDDGSVSFQLGGGSSEWLENGGPAHCVANLYYWDFHPVQKYNKLATTEFEAAG